MLDTQLDPHSLAASAVSSVVLATDSFSQTVGPDFWIRSGDAHRAVARAVAALPAGRIRELARGLGEDPADVPAYRQLTDAIAAYFEQPDQAGAAGLAMLIREAETRSRLRVNPGDGAGASLPGPGPADLLAAARQSSRRRRAASRRRDQVDAAVVIPFRAPADGDDRVRNLAAALNALSDQSHSRDRYRIVVVESDTVPRWRDMFAPVCDVYLFAPCPAAFNKSWAVNVGVVHGARPADLVCVLDADILVDRDFIGRAVARFERSSGRAHWPYHDMLFLDDQASRRAVVSRCLRGASGLDPGQLRGVYLRRPPGGCIWLRESMFTRIGGMDERFCGWGGEDQDFVWRIERYWPLDRYPEPLLHLNHRRASHRGEDDLPFYHGIRFCSWRGDAKIGDLGKYLEHPSERSQEAARDDFARFAGVSS